MSIKAFELVPAIERVKLMSDKAKTQVGKRFSVSAGQLCSVNLAIVSILTEWFLRLSRFFVLTWLIFSLR